ncbi:cysteine desulfurase family protein [Micrococcoides hystricis]|uniref:Cysteine desulfurase family protein n=1 Tax=Micrococcoides hystricis TaxID=1572761 RepID=A0ABV6PAB8_9MICC
MKEPRQTYLDHAATTPLRQVAQQAWLEHQSTANPSSLHSAGRTARHHLEQAREQIAALAGAEPAELIFTSGGTEADNLALKGLYLARRTTERNAILLTGIEHLAVLETCQYLETQHGAELVFAPVDAEGVVDLEAWERLLSQHRDSLAAATLMWANNEVGTIQPVKEAVALAAQHRVPVHVDAVQAFGAIPVNFADCGAATMAVSGHKLGAPVGVGGLFVRRDITLHSVSQGGGQERKIRSGTMNVAAAAAFAAAASEAVANMSQTGKKLVELRNRLIEAIQEAVPAARLCGPADEDGTQRLPNNVHFIFPNCEGDSLLFMLDMQKVYSSTGSACTAGVPKPSHVVLAMGNSEADSRSVQRFTLGHDSTIADVEHVAAVIGSAYEHARQAGMAAQTARIKTASDGW